MADEESFKVEAIEDGEAKLISFTDFQRFTMPLSLLPVGLSEGHTVSLRITRKATDHLQDRILRLQDDIAVFLRTRAHQSV